MKLWIGQTLILLCTLSSLFRLSPGKKAGSTLGFGKRSFAVLLQDLKAAMEQECIVPDVIDEAPPCALKVTYDGGVEVQLGNELTPTQVRNPPNVCFTAEEDVLYTLIMTDPDAPSRQSPKFREWHHWLIVNIPSADVKKGETLSEYVGAGPPKGSGLHRYVFLLYKQPQRLQCDEKKLTNRSGDHRANFHARDFAKRYSLGSPIAGNFFQAAWDDYVPKLYEQLSGE